MSTRLIEEFKRENKFKSNFWIQGWYTPEELIQLLLKGKKNLYHEFFVSVGSDIVPRSLFFLYGSIHDRQRKVKDAWSRAVHVIAKTALVSCEGYFTRIPYLHCRIHNPKLHHMHNKTVASKAFATNQASNNRIHHLRGGYVVMKWYIYPKIWGFTIITNLSSSESST